MLKLTLEQAARRLEAGKTDFLRFIEQAGYDVSLYRPDGTDPQSPHARDELYVIAAGTGDFICDGEATKFKPGDLLFVPAGVAHRFNNFSPDFATWVVFFGPRPA
jgi:mannose-6-phosphate isomerase-like protein (cupin superfamily)